MLLTMRTVRQLDMWIVSILLTCTDQVVAVVLSKLGYQYTTRFVLRDVFRLSLTVGVCDLASAASPGGRGYFEGESCNRRHPQSTGVTVKIIHEPSHHANVDAIIFIVDLVLSLEDLNISAFCVVVRRTGSKADVFSRRKTRPGIRFGGSVNGRRHMSCCVVRGSGQSVSSTCLERARRACGRTQLEGQEVVVAVSKLGFAPLASATKKTLRFWDLGTLRRQPGQHLH
jgi:hypothetical protein